MVFAGVGARAAGAGLAVVEQRSGVLGHHVLVHPVGKVLHIGRRLAARHARGLVVAQVVGDIARGDDQEILLRQRRQRLADAVGVFWPRVALHR